MAIEFFSDKITFGNFSLKLTDSGMEVINLTNNAAGKLYATDFQGFGTFQGTVAGYTAGGFGPSYSNVIDKFPFAADTNAIDVGDLTNTNSLLSAGNLSQTFGYRTGGYTPEVNTIDKFPFAVDTNATDVGDLSSARSAHSGQSSTVHGYASGGKPSPAPVNIIEKFPFAVDTNATDVGDLTQGRYGLSGQSSSTHGYSSGGATAPGAVNTIDKFSFAVDSNATDVGDLIGVNRTIGGVSSSSTVSGYVMGGVQPALPPGGTNTIQKYPFATNSNATDIGDLTDSRIQVAGHSSVVSGYRSGGYIPGGTNIIDKFPFSTDSNATDVGDLTVARRGSASTHN